EAFSSLPPLPLGTLVLVSRSELANVTGEVHQPGPIGPEPEEAGLWQLEALGVPRWALEQDHQASRSGGSSSVSSGEKKKPLRWKIDAKDKKVPLSSLTHVAQLKLKRGDLVSFAARHPGALTAEQFSGLTEVRDMKEVVTSAEILDAVNREEISQALDVLCQRILAIQAAKQKGGTWEKAEAIELVDNRKSLASASKERLGFSDFYGRIANTLQAQVMTDEPVLGPQGIDDYLRHSRLYSGSGVVLALGVQGGVPDKAADVQLADHLDVHGDVGFAALLLTCRSVQDCWCLRGVEPNAKKSVNGAAGEADAACWAAEDRLRYDPSSAKSERAELASSEPTVDIAELGCWPSHQLLFIHLCGGPRRSGDLLDAVEMLDDNGQFRTTPAAKYPVCWIPYDFVFCVSYSSFLRWVKKLSFLPGGDGMVISTHSFR
ncbi:unnamed protein product, partial [Cladocopium goreaui]